MVYHRKGQRHAFIYHTNVSSGVIIDGESGSYNWIMY
jgi:hypothetical protein